MGESPAQRAHRLLEDALTGEELGELKYNNELIRGLVNALPVRPGTKSEIYSLAKGRSGGLTLDDVRSVVYLPCPFRLSPDTAVSKKLPFSRILDVDFVFKMKLTKQFFADKDDLDDPDGAHCMLFRWPRFGVAVMHDVRIDDSVHGASLRYTNEKTKAKIAIEPVAAFFKSLKKQGIEFE